MSDTITEKPTVNTAAMSAIYRRAAAITANATTQDPRWWWDVMAETDAFLTEAMGEGYRMSICTLPTLDDVISSNPDRLGAALDRIAQLEARIAQIESAAPDPK